jgi:endonuclease V-like protein UPF0215 family
MAPVSGRRKRTRRPAATRGAAAAIIGALAVSGSIPEVLRTAHLMAGAIGTGQSRGRP